MGKRSPNLRVTDTHTQSLDRGWAKKDRVLCGPPMAGASVWREAPLEN